MLIRAISFACVAVFAGGLITAQAQTVQQPCGDTPPEYTAAWRNFSAAVENNYGDTSDLSFADRYKVFGHALGRFSEGAGRGLDAECVRAKLQIDAVDRMIMGDATDYMALSREAEAGRHDGRVAQLTGVTDTSAFSHRDIARRGDDTLVAGETVGGRIGLSDGSRVIYEDGSSEDFADNSGNFEDADSLWSDLKRTPGSGRAELASGRGYMMDPPPGVNDIDRWKYQSDYGYCVQATRKTYELGVDHYDGGISPGTIFVIALDEDGLYHCIGGSAPFLKRYPDEMQAREQKLLRECHKYTHPKDPQWCRTWYIN